MKTNEIVQKELVVSLLADYLIHYRLIRSLNNLGLDANTYAIQLGDTIFKLMGFGETIEAELIYDRFYELSQKVMLLDIKHQQKEFNELVAELYKWLQEERRKYEKTK